MNDATLSDVAGRISVPPVIVSTGRSWYATQGSEP
jgi:hypothetical protein